MECSNNIIFKPKSEWVGCDGKIISDELIKAQLESAVKEERYEHASKCQNELQRRRNKKGAVL